MQTSETEEEARRDKYEELAREHDDHGEVASPW